MPINPAIALGVQPMQLADPLAQYGKFAAIQQAQSQNALAQYQLDAARRESEKAAALNALYAGAVTPEGGIDYNKLIAGAAQQNLGSLVPRIQKSQREYEESAAKANEAFGKAVEQRMKVSRELLNGVSTPEQYLAWHEANHRDPVLAKFFAERGITAEDARGRIQAAVAAGPQAFAQLLAESKIGAEKVAAQVAEANKPMSVAAGASVYDPRAKTFTQAPAAPTRPTPGETEELVTRLQDPALTPAARQRLEARLDILTKQEPKEPKEPPAPTITQIQDPADPNRMLTIDARRYAGGSVGAPGVIGTSGKTAPAAAAEQKKIAAQNELQNVIDTLKTAYDDLNAMRAVPSEQRNVISNALSYIASTGPGQVVGRIGGTAAQTQRDIIQSSRNLLFTAVKNATGKTSGELNSNVEFKTWLNALTDPSRSIQANQAILENLEKFVASGGNYSARKSEGQVKPAPGAPPRAPAAGASPYQNLSNEELLRQLGVKPGGR